MRARAKPEVIHRIGIEAELVAKCRLGEEDAIAALVHAHTPRLRWVAWRVVRNWADVEDVVQDTLWKAYQHLPGYRERAPISAWLSRIALNEGVRLLRNRRTRKIDLAGPDVPLYDVPPVAARGDSPEQILVSNEIHEIVCNCIERMRPDYRAILSLRILDDLSYAEIAQRLELSLGAVKTRIHRARRVLRGMLCQLGLPSIPDPDRNEIGEG